MDRREQIMARMLVLLGGMTGIETAARNLDEISDLKTPAVVLYDGNESAFDNARAVGGKPNMINAEPIIVLNLGDVPEAAGTSVNGWLIAIKKALLLDSELENLCGVAPTSGIRYVGSETSLSPGRATQVTIVANFNASYTFQPTEL